jgi:hypothetical protein
MNGKFESCSNNQDESDVNQYLKELSEVSDWRSRRNASVCQDPDHLSRSRDCRLINVRFGRDSVAKVPRGAAANFPPKNEKSDNHRPVEPQTRFQNRL